MTRKAFSKQEFGIDKILTMVVVGLAIALFVLLSTAPKDNVAISKSLGPTSIPTIMPTASASNPTDTTECITSTENRMVRGNSMEGILSDGDVVAVQFGYYGCNAPKKGDVALVHFSGDPNPLVKTIKATPGDSFSLSQAACGWNIIVNGNALQNSKGDEYCIGYSGYRMLSLYQKSYNGAIPQGAYLVLGNLVQGSTDSTRFGLTSKSSLLGKVEIPAKSA